MPSRQRRRVYSAITLTVLPLLALGAYTIVEQLREEQEFIAASRVQLARSAALAVESFIEGHVSTARSLALHPSLARLEATPELEQFIKRVSTAHSDWEGLGIHGPDGYSLYGFSRYDPVPAPAPARRVYVGDRPYFKQAVSTGRPAVSTAVISRLTGKTMIVIAAPFDVASGGRGILAVPLPTDLFGDRLRSRTGAGGGELIVVDASSQIFIGADPQGTRSLLRATGPAVDAVLKGESGSLRIERDGDEILAAFAPVAPYGFGVLLTQSTSAAFSPARHQALVRAATLAGILASVLVLGWFLGGWLAQAFEREASARARAEELARALARSVETRDDFLASVSHDLRNPLGTVQAAAETLARSVERSGAVPPERLDACVTHIRRAARHMSVLVDGFMDAARVQLGQPLELARERIDVAALVREVVDASQETTSRHRLVCNAPDSAFATVDGPRLHRVLSNVVGNAIKYSPEGGEVRIDVETSASSLNISVADRGIGIPPEDLGRVFTRFERGSNAAGRFPGTGIGLSGARQVVERHGGTISARAREGGGTTITIQLPLDPEAA